MKEELKQIIEHYGIDHQLRKFNEESLELEEAIIKHETLKDYYFKNTNWLKQHIVEELADVTCVLKQFQYHYGIEDKEIEEVMKFKIERQLERIKNENNN